MRIAAGLLEGLSPCFIWLAVCALACIPAHAEDNLNSSGESVYIDPLHPTPAGAESPTLLPQAEMSASGDPAVDPATGEHPVYKLRPEPFSDSGTMTVTLADVLGLAVEHNLGLQGQKLLVEKGHYAVDQTYYVFDPSYQAALNYSRRNTGGASSLQQGGVTSSESTSASFDYTIPRQFGDDLTFSYDLSRSSFSVGGTGSGGGTDVPTTYGSGASIGYTRPLLRGAGKYLNGIPRFIASNNLQLSYAQLDDRIRTLKSQVLDTYFLAVAARQGIDVRSAALEVALRQLDRAVERYKVGLAIQSDVLQAENTVLNQRSALLSAEDQYRALLDTLTTLTGLPQEYELTVDAGTELLDLDPDKLPQELPADLWDMVLTNSYDLKSLNTELANLRLSRDQLLDRTRPQLDLNLSYGRTGEDKAIGGALGGLENENYQAGLTWRRTPGERAAKADVATNELDLASAQLQIQDTELTLKSRLRELQRQLDVKAQQIQLMQSNVVVTQQTLNIVTERANVGLATTLEVVQAEEDKLAADLALLQAKVDYQQSYREIMLLAGLI